MTDAAVHSLVKQVVARWMKTVDAVPNPAEFKFPLCDVYNAIYNARKDVVSTGSPPRPTNFSFDGIVLDTELNNVMGKVTEWLCDALEIVMPIKFPKLALEVPRVTNADYRSGLGDFITIYAYHSSSSTLVDK
jgi:hypothetical protein